MTRGKDTLIRLTMRGRPHIPFDEIVKSPDPDAKAVFREMLEALRDADVLWDYLSGAVKTAIFYGRDDPEWLEAALGDDLDDELKAGDDKALIEEACRMSTPRMLDYLVKIFPEATLAPRRWTSDTRRKDGDDGSWLHTLAEGCVDEQADDFEICAKTLLAAGVDPGGKDRAGRSVGDILAKDGKGECLARWERIAMSGDGKIKKGTGGKTGKPRV